MTCQANKVDGQYPLLAPSVAVLKWFEGACACGTGIVWNELIHWYANVVHTSASFRPHRHTHTHACTQHNTTHTAQYIDREPMGIKVDIASGWYVNRLAVSVSCAKRDVTVGIVPSHMPIKADHQLSVSHQGECAAGRATMCFVVAGLCSRQNHHVFCCCLSVHQAESHHVFCCCRTMHQAESHHVFCCCRPVQQAEPPWVLLLPVRAAGRATMRFVVASLWCDWFSPARVFISWRSTSLRAPLASRWSW